MEWSFPKNVYSPTWGVYALFLYQYLAIQHDHSPFEQVPKYFLQGRLTKYAMSLGRTYVDDVRWPSVQFNLEISLDDTN
jgi:hypothetical protein